MKGRWQQWERTLKANGFFCGCGGMGIVFKNAIKRKIGEWRTHGGVTQCHNGSQKIGGEE